MNTFGFNAVDAIAGLVTFVGAGLFLGFMFQFIKFVMFGFMNVRYQWKRKETEAVQ